MVFYTENLGVPCQTDPIYIENWLKENANEEIIIFTTYQSGRLIAEISKKLHFKFDIGIFDEAHKTVGSDKKLFSHLLFEQNVSIQKRIFMTATERFYKGSKDDIISMDDETIYGDTFTKMSFKEAIELELLSDYKVITIDVQKSEIANFIKENNLVQLNDKWSKETEARSLASMLALRKAMKQFPIKNAVSFHSSIEKATRNKELQGYITDSFDFDPIDTFTVSGKQPTTKRNAIVNEFAKSSKALITNAKCLTEGVDVPNIDCIVFADPRKSKVDIVQALGRALRKKEGKEWGYVILPVIYDDVTHEIDNENFEEILAIVRGLASNDERIIEYFKDKSDKLSSTKKTDKQFNFDVFSEFINEDELSEQLQIRLWDKLSRFNWMPFEEAREFVRGLGLKNQSDWTLYCKSGEKPSNIPSNPYGVYSREGWISFPDFLGYVGYFRQFLPFEEARQIVVALKFKNAKEWNEYLNSKIFPTNIPKRPHAVYKNQGWKGINYWLGLYEKVINFKSFQETKELAQVYKINSSVKWRSFCKSDDFPKDIPKYPDIVYKKKGWINWGDFLGTGKFSDNKREYLEFNLAKEYINKLGLKNSLEWRKYCVSGKLPNYIPKKPEIIYKDKGWLGISDWLGVKNYRSNQINRLSYSEAKKIVHGFRLNSWSEWRAFCKSDDFPFNIPKNPNSVYKNEGWSNWGEWLGTMNLSTSKITFLSFKESKKEVKKLGINSIKEWRDLCQSNLKPSNLPVNPYKVYKNEWKSWGDWLGTGRVSNQFKKFLPFMESKNFAKSLGLKNEKEWRIYKKEFLLPENIPLKPEVVYKGKGWNGFVDWFGITKVTNINKTFRTFNEAREYVHGLKLKNNAEWRDFCKSDNRPFDIPSNPNVYYKSEWKGWADFLGKE